MYFRNSLSSKNQLMLKINCENLNPYTKLGHEGDMSKNIVYFADGTWQGAKTADKSNVLKIFAALSGMNSLGQALDAEQEKVWHGDNLQSGHVAKYIHGVGDGGNSWENIFGGGFGSGLVYRLLRGYTFISRNYAPGDKIFLVGFSRGAYTARALAGLIAAKGLLDWAGLGLSNEANNAQGQDYACKAWQDYMQERGRGDPPKGFLGQLHMHIAKHAGGDEDRDVDGLEPRYISDVPIDSVAVWDTVGSMGIPRNLLSSGARVDYLQFTDTTLSLKVEAGFHAVAIDERRFDFTPTLWDADPRIEQRLFAGAHADVGGGYPDSGGNAKLAAITLHWMAEKLSGRGLALTVPPPPLDAPLGPHHKPWEKLPFLAGKKIARQFKLGPAELPLHNAVQERLGKMVMAISDGWFGTQQLTYWPESLVLSGHIP
jgi:hypothetical protein